MKVRGRQYISVLVVSIIFTIGLMSAITPVKAAYVKVYVSPHPVPFVAPGGRVSFDIIIETSGIADDSLDGIVAWGLDIRVDPASLDLSKYRAVGATSGYFLWEFADWYWYDYPTLLGGTVDVSTGYVDDVAESIMPTPPGGAGDPWSGYKLVTIQMLSASDTKPCLIDLIDVEYKSADGTIHPVDIVVDGWYGTPPPRTMSYQGSLLPPGDPTGTQWHELYPQYCNMWDLVGWTDNMDGDLTASDQIDMVNETGWTYHFHVDAVLITIHWTFKSPDVGEGAGEPYETHLIEIGEDSVSGEPEIINPIGSSWHQIYPPEDYCKEFVITSHEDTDGDGNLDISEQFDFEYFGEGVVHWAHLDDITTDIIVSQKGEPEPPVPEFPLGAAVEVGLIVAVAYIWWTRRRKLKEVP